MLFGMCTFLGFCRTTFYKTVVDLCTKNHFKIHVFHMSGSSVGRAAVNRLAIIVSRYCTGNSCNEGSYGIREKILLISLGCKLVPVQYRQYEFGISGLMWSPICLLGLMLWKESFPTRKISDQVHWQFEAILCPFYTKEKYTYENRKKHTNFNIHCTIIYRRLGN